MLLINYEFLKKSSTHNCPKKGGLPQMGFRCKPFSVSKHFWCLYEYPIISFDKSCNEGLFSLHFFISRETHQKRDTRKLGEKSPFLRRILRQILCSPCCRTITVSDYALTTNNKLKLELDFNGELESAFPFTQRCTCEGFSKLWRAPGSLVAHDFFFAFKLEIVCWW